LTPLDAVRKRPGMYIGDTADGTGLHNMLYEVVDNAINEALAGHCEHIDVTLNAGGSVTVRDNGRGIPLDTHPDDGVSAAEIIMTRLQGSGKVAPTAPKMLRARHGVGVAVVNALSDVLELRIWRGGKENFMRFRLGNPEAPLAVVGDAGLPDGKPRRGTEITFCPWSKIFTKTEFDFATIERHLRELTFLNCGVTIALADRRGIANKEVVLRV
jgi:DNA gyrase subunit B